MPDLQKVKKLIDRAQGVVNYLEENRDFVVHQHIDQFHYMQKIVELKTLTEQCAEMQLRLAALEKMTTAQYEALYWVWRKDMRWLKENVGVKV